MRIPRLYLESALKAGNSVSLPADKAHYVRNVLRLKSGQSVHLFNGADDFDYGGELQISGRTAQARITERLPIHAESPLAITLVQAIGKSEHLDFIVQKATELGVSRLLLFNSTRTQAPIKAPRLNKKLGHWRGIIESACEQCGRSRLPELIFAPDLESGLASLPTAQRLVLDLNGQPFDQAVDAFNQSSIQVVIGPEGGLTDQETNLAKSLRFASCRLGPRTLRMETAATAIITLIQQRLGDL